MCLHRAPGTASDDWPLAVIVAAFVVLAAFYATVNPILEGPDEVWHYDFARYVAAGRGLPQASRPPEDWAEQPEALQPPLYYALAAVASFWVKPDDPPYVLNRHAAIGAPLTSDNKNIVLHSDREAFPYRGTSLAVYLIRALTILLGVATIVVTYRLALELKPDQKEVAALAAALTAFLPMFTYLSGTVTNDILMALFGVVGLLLLVRLLRREPGMPDLVVLGGVLGLAALTKLSGLGLAILAALLLAVRAWRAAARAQWIRYVFAVVLPFVGVCGWWYIRNWLAYGDPFGLSGWIAIHGLRWPTPSVQDLWASGELQGARWSLWGVFGSYNILADQWFYRTIDVIYAVAALGLVGHVICQGRRRAWAALLPVALLSGWFLTVLWLFLRWTQTILGSQGRLLFPAVSAAAVLASIGVTTLVPRRWSPVAAGVLALAMFCLSALVPFRYLAPAYALPERVFLYAIDGSALRTNIVFVDEVALRGLGVDRRTVSSGESLELTTYWQSLRATNRNYSAFFHLYDPSGQRIAALDTHPAGGTYPTSAWKPGEVIKRTHRLPVPSETAAAVGSLKVGLYLLPSTAPLPAWDQMAGRPLGAGPLPLRVRVLPPGGSAKEPSTERTAEYGGVVALRGFDLSAERVVGGQQLSGRLYWRALAPMGRDYTVFVQLLGADGLLAQYDSQPQGGRSPTSFWEPGEEVVDEFSLTIPPGLPPGRYPLIAGLYDLVTIERLPTGAADHIVLAEITVGP